MSRSKLEELRAVFNLHMGAAVRAESEGNYAAAIQHAKGAWPVVSDIMRFERKYEDSERESDPSIDLVLRLAPLLFDRSSLRELEALLRTAKGIDRMATDDLAERVREANLLLAAVHRLWCLIENSPGILQADLLRLPDAEPAWRTTLQSWEDMGLIRRVESGGSLELRITTNTNERVRARCMECGSLLAAEKRSFLIAGVCPVCKVTTDFVIQTTADGFAA